jgi:hypothetical protein
VGPPDDLRLVDMDVVVSCCLGVTLEELCGVVWWQTYQASSLAIPPRGQSSSWHACIAHVIIPDFLTPLAV